MQVSPSEFSLRISESLQHRLGVMNVISERVKFPLIERSLAQPYTDAVLLIGDAAHTIHPLAGQGANCGLQDAIWFAHCYQQWCENASRRTAGVQRLFTAYFRRRTVDYQFLRYAMRVFSEGFCESSSWVVSMRSTLMTATDQLVGIKQKMMQVMTDLGQLPKISNISSFENQPNG